MGYVLVVATPFFVPLTEDNIVDPDSATDCDPSREFTGRPDMMPGVSAQRAVLHRSDTLVVAAFRFEAYPTGFAFTIHAEGTGYGYGRFHFIFSLAPGGYMGAPTISEENGPVQLDDIFRVGLEFSDDTASDYLVNLDRGGPQIQSTGCSGSGGGKWGKCIGGFWVPRVPPPGEFTLHTALPVVGMEESSATFNADDIIEKSAHALPLLDKG